MRLENDYRNYRLIWRQDDLNYIKAHMSESNRSLAKKFGRKVNGISSIKSKIRKESRNDNSNRTTQDH